MESNDDEGMDGFLKIADEIFKSKNEADIRKFHKKLYEGDLKLNLERKLVTPLISVMDTQCKLLEFFVKFWQKIGESEEKANKLFIDVLGVCDENISGEVLVEETNKRFEEFDQLNKSDQDQAFLDLFKIPLCHSRDCIQAYSKGDTNLAWTYALDMRVIYMHLSETLLAESDVSINCRKAAKSRHVLNIQKKKDVQKWYEDNRQNYPTIIAMQEAASDKFSLALSTVQKYWQQGEKPQT